MKKLVTFFVLAFLLQGMTNAQIPSGYYDSAAGKTGQALKTALFNIIKNPSVTSYDGLWTSFKTTDKDNYYEKDGTVLDIYSENPSGADPYEFTFGTEQCGTYSTEGNCYNREHSFPKSWFNSASPMVSDLFHIYPTDGKVNGERSNYPYGPNNGELFTSMNGSKLGACTASGYTGTVFEPIDEFKGDLARSYFYMATCYEDKISGWSSVVLDGTSFPCYKTWFLNILLQWNAQDPVSQKEIDRNNAIYKIQGNRNPFIDHPEYVNEIWGNGSSSSVPATPANFAISSTSSQINLSWSDVSNETGYYVYRSTDNSNFSTIASIDANSTSYSDASVSAGTVYYYYVKAYNDQGVGSATSTLNGQISSSGGSNATDLFFSEYVEGSSYNKALEISNFTGANIDLSSYVIKKQANGAGAWSSGLSLSGTITQGESYVIANSNASQAVLDKANLTSNATEMSFNGNDPVSLWKNGVLIDIIGTFNSTASFGTDVTMIRNADVSSPNTTYTTSEWTDKPKDYFDNLGTHTFSGGSTADTQAPSAPASLAASNITQTSLDLSWTASTDNVGVTAYDVYEDGSLLTSTSSVNYSVTGLTAGASYSFYVKAKDAAGNVSAASNTVNATTQQASLSYCSSAGQTVTDEWIGKVQLATINNSSSNSNGGYSDFTAQSTTLNRNASYTITITPTWSGTLYNEGEAVWIDYNHDGDFDDAGEQVASISASQTSPVSATFTVPASALSGATRMRVSLKYNGIPSACETFSYGEVEDYTVNISGTADTQAPSAPTSLAASNITQTSLDLSWTASTDNVGVTAYDVYENGTLLTSTSSVNYSVTGLTAGTSYSFYVKAKDAAGNVSAASNTVNATTLQGSVSYCSAGGTNTNYEYINRVKFNSIDKTSGANGGYADFTSNSTSVNSGNTYTLNLYPGFASSSYNEAWAVWIDYNHDGDFSDAGELVYSHAASSSSVTGSVTIPSGAVAGSTRMRVAMEYNTIPSSACGSFTYGEVEDYTVNIGLASAKGAISNVNEQDQSINISIYPNPTKDKLFINNAEKSIVNIYSLNGKLVLKQKLMKNYIDLSKLNAGMYIIRINNGENIYNSKFVKQ